MKLNSFKKVVCLLAFISFSTFSFAQKVKAVKDKLLDNKVYEIEINEDGAKKPKPVKDEMSFKGQKIKSKFMDEKYMLNSGMYVVSVDTAYVEGETEGTQVLEKTINFTAESVNGDKEKLAWAGTVVGEDIEGTVILSKKDKVKKQWTFSGTQKTKKKK
jgi:hypothetical protein